jgi:hypothetical protein
MHETFATKLVTPISPYFEPEYESRYRKAVLMSHGTLFYPYSMAHLAVMLTNIDVERSVQRETLAS